MGRSRGHAKRAFAPLILSHEIPLFTPPTVGRAIVITSRAGEAETPPRRPGSGTLTADRPAIILPEAGHGDGGWPTGRNRGRWSGRSAAAPEGACAAQVRWALRLS